MRSSRARLRTALLGLATTCGLLVSTGTATAADVQLNGNWSPFTRCPVDSPAMLAADGVTDIALCVSSQADTGSIKLGNTTTTTGVTSLQFGVVQHADSSTTVIPPSGGSIVAAPAAIPGGLLGLMCPSDIPLVTAICNGITDGTLNKVVATVESVGTPTDFKPGAGLSMGQPILALPVRIKLENPFLSDNCYIGSASDPIVLHPRNLTAPALASSVFTGDGTPTTDPSTAVLNRIAATGASQGDSSFAVPGARGCGLLGLVDLAVNLKTALPSSAGNNSLTLNSASTYVAGFINPTASAPDNGRLLAQYWHSAVR